MNLADLMNRIADDADTALLPDPAQIRRRGDELRRRQNTWISIGGIVTAVVAIVAAIALVFPGDRPTPEPAEPHLEQTTPLAYDGGSGIWTRTDEQKTVTQLGTLEVCGGPCVPYDLAWSPDGRTLAVLTGPECCAAGIGISVVLLSRDGSDPRRVFGCPTQKCTEGYPRSLAWSRDSRHLAVTVDTETFLVPADGGAGPELVCDCRATDPTFLADGTLAYVDDGRLRARDLTSGETTTLLTSAGMMRAEWSPDGRWVVLTEGDGFLSLVDMSSSPPTRVTPQHVAGLGPRWSPEGDRFAYSTQRGRDRESFRPEVWVATPGDSPTLLHQFPRGGGWSDPVWSPDGTRVALWIGDGKTGGTVRVLDAATGEVLHSIRGPADGALAWAPEPGGSLD